jgi:hypothetical protein
LFFGKPTVRYPSGQEVRDPAGELVFQSVVPAQAREVAHRLNIAKTTGKENRSAAADSVSCDRRAHYTFGLT